MKFRQLWFSSAGCLLAWIGLAQTQNRLFVNVADGQGQDLVMGENAVRTPIRFVVKDQTGRLIEGATIALTILIAVNGAGAAFLDGGQTASLTTGADGQALVSGIRANQVPGSFRIRVHATKEGMTPSQPIQVKLTNVRAPASPPISPKLKWLIVGAAAAGVAIVGTGLAIGDPEPPPGRTVIEIGRPRVGGQD